MSEPTIPGRRYRMSNCRDSGGISMRAWDGMIVECIGVDQYRPMGDRPDSGGSGAFRWPSDCGDFTPLAPLFDPTDIDSVVNFLVNI